MKMVNEINQSVIPNPDPDTACGNADNGGYTVQPDIAGPDSTNNDTNIITDEILNNQADIILMNPDAISRAPICNGINTFENVPLSPPVNTKKTIIVPCIVTKPRYIS